MGGAPPVEAGSGVRCSGRSSDHGQRFTRTEEGTVQQRSRALNLTGTFLCGFPGKGHVHIGGGGRAETQPPSPPISLPRRRDWGGGDWQAGLPGPSRHSRVGKLCRPGSRGGHGIRLIGLPVPRHSFVQRVVRVGGAHQRLDAARGGLASAGPGQGLDTAAEQTGTPASFFRSLAGRAGFGPLPRGRPRDA